MLSRNFTYSVLIFTILFSGCSNRFRDGETSPEKGLKSSYKMKPYEINGKWYYPKREIIGKKTKSIVSWYGDDYQGKITASGETFNMYDPTAAHKTHPMNTMLYVKNVENGKSVIVRVNDRGPFIAGRELDLSKRAGQEIGIIKNGTAEAEITIIGYDGNIDQGALAQAEASGEREMEEHFARMEREARELEQRETKITPIVQGTFSGTEIIEKPIYNSKEESKTEESEVITLAEKNSTLPQQEVSEPSSEIIEILEPIDLESNSSEAEQEKKLQESIAEDEVQEVTNLVVKPKTPVNSGEFVRNYYVQVASFENQNRAESFAEKSSEMLPQNLSLEIRHERGLYRVWVSGFTNGDEAREFNNAKDYFPSSFLVYRDERE